MMTVRKNKKIVDQKYKMLTDDVLDSLENVEIYFTSAFSIPTIGFYEIVDSLKAYDNNKCELNELNTKIYKNRIVENVFLEFINNLSLEIKNEYPYIKDIYVIYIPKHKSCLWGDQIFLTFNIKSKDFIRERLLFSIL